MVKKAKRMTRNKKAALANQVKNLAVEFFKRALLRMKMTWIMMMSIMTVDLVISAITSRDKT